MTVGRFFWKVFLINAAVMATVLGLCTLVILHEFDRFQAHELFERLAAQARTLAAAIDARLDSAHADELQKLVRSIGVYPEGGVRITIMEASGEVLADSAEDPRQMDNHANRPEFVAAMRDGMGESTRWSHTVSTELMYVALRVGRADGPRGVIRVSAATTLLGQWARPWRRLLATIGAASVGAVVALALSLGLLWSRRIGQLTAAARTLSLGDLGAAIPVSGHDEVAILGMSLNRMRDRLSRQLQTIDRQRRTLESLVWQLHEGVVVADADGRLVMINPEADRLLGISRMCGGPVCVGLPVEQCVRQLDLQDMLRGRDAAAGGGEAVPAEQPAGQPAWDGAVRREMRLVVDTDTGPVTLLARAFDVQLPSAAADLAGAESMPRGRLLVLTDVTELDRLVQVKADFASNASHELRTPLAAIRAALDTLKEVDTAADPQMLRRTLGIIERHSGRMESMVVDLLDLSRVESSMSKFDPSPVRTRAVLDEIQHVFADALTAGELHWDVHIDDACRNIVVNREVLGIALRNLTDNAIRFTGRGGRVWIDVRTDGDHVVIEVHDTGCGIPAADQERVFERFYQVQRARSGVQRGTGLGLSIVRHAAAAMNGRVALRSEVGVGTTVSLWIPRRP